MPINLDPNFLNLITQIMGGVSGKVNNAVLGAPIPTQGAPQSSALTGLAQNRAQAGQQMLGGVLSAPSSPAQAAPAPARKPQGALSPLQKVDLGNQVTEAYAGNGAEQGPQQNAPALDIEQYAAPPDLSRGPQQGQPPALVLAQYEQGILGKVGDFLGPNFVGRLGDGLLVAGSQDPARALAQLSAQRAEEEEAKAKRAAAGRPKVTPLADGSFSLVSFPDGSTKVIRNSEVADYQTQKAELGSANKMVQMLLQGKINADMVNERIDAKTSAEARPMLNDTINLREKYGQALEMIDGQGTWAQVQGVPGISGIANFFGTDDSAKNKFLQGLAVSETLLNTALTKGAISNQEMNLFKSPIPSLSDDREKVWKPFIQQRMQVLKKLEDFQRSEVARGERGGSSEVPQAPQATPKAGGMAVPGLSPRASQYFQ